MIELSKAKKVADEIVNTLRPFCHRIDVAGSVRRQKTFVKDVEIVCMVEDINKFAFVLYDKYRVPKIKRDSRYIQFSAITCMVDLFIPQKHDYYRQLAIRTGSAEFSHHVIANAWVKNGWVGTDNGLRRKIECEQHSKRWVVLPNQKVTLPPVWQSEEDFFHWLGLPYLPPNKREYNG